MEPIERQVRETVAALNAAGPGDVEVIDCDPELADTAAFCEAYGYAPEDSANAIVVASKTDPPAHAVCLVLSTTRLDVNKTVRKRLGARKASFASAEATTELTGMTPGGVTPFALPPGVPVWVDAAVMARARIVVGGGSRACKVVGPPEMLRSVPDLEVVDGLAVPVDR